MAVALLIMILMIFVLFQILLSTYIFLCNSLSAKCFHIRYYHILPIKQVIIPVVPSMQIVLILSTLCRGQESLYRTFSKISMLFFVVKICLVDISLINGYGQ